MRDDDMRRGVRVPRTRPEGRSGGPGINLRRPPRSRPEHDDRRALAGPQAGVADPPGATREEPETPETILETEGLGVTYGGVSALRDVGLRIGFREITALIGPSGCGKSTLLRCFNRMNDLIPGVGLEGTVRYRGLDLYGAEVDPIEVRRRIGMVFQKPNPFPKTIFENVAFGLRLPTRRPSGLDEAVEEALTRAALWDEVKDKLHTNALALSGGQQQRLCIARCIAVRPEVILMDEPCSALDPIATARIEDLMAELRRDFTIVIVTHNMQQAARVADRTAFFTALVEPGTSARYGVLVECDRTEVLFTNPSRRETEDYITGRFG